MNIENILNSSIAVIIILTLIVVAIKICLIYWIRQTEKNTDEIIQIMADIDHNNQVRHQQLLEELQSINKNDTRENTINNANITDKSELKSTEKK